MRTVRGRTDRVVVVGAGLGGLACAIRLAGSGRQVTVLERAGRPGGRAGLLADRGFRFDTGPTVLTMPRLIADTFAAVGEKLDDWLELTRLDPAYRAHFPDGSTLDVRAEVADTAEEIRRVCGAREADGYLRFVDYTRFLHDLEWDAFIDRNLDTPLDLLGGPLARLVAAGGFRRLSGKVNSFFDDPRTRRIFSFQALYAGVPPHKALALYAVISYLDTVAGVYFPRGGMHAMPAAMAAVATKHGVDIRYGHAVTEVEMAGGRAVAVRTADERIAADVVVLNPDLPVARRDLLKRPLRRPLRHSPSCVLLHIGASKGFSRIAHHNIHVGRAWRRTFDELTGGRLMSDPSLLVSNPSRSDPSLAPAGQHAYYVLAPVPNLKAPIDWKQHGERYADEILRVLEARGYRGLTDATVVRHVVTPDDWSAAGMAAGTPFALAHTFSQTGPMRPANLAYDNVVFVGSGTQPGVGVPMVLVSGRLAAERITGPISY
ncbi:phytoene desaturase family protein [Fodinicola acaciae]|uniref:phytoene desaturase family protein n=1 Tax=Fodinicola acaciae TaxID=2681555 RepID=UPI0013D1B4AB|nr:phytoene desaturase family protein [Fodinicola acaciae]